MARTVTTLPRPEPEPSMSLIGYLLAAGVALLLLPLLPFLAVLWVAYRLLGGGRSAEATRGARRQRAA
ncbi:DUF7535 family protein [Halorussus sp. AFM4]|uniref:DUF7535 family protein n=1 Tax=Halorussus sp. AFM4 TaxID=3421651 RepID=UPI003EB71287